MRMGYLPYQRVNDAAKTYGGMKIGEFITTMLGGNSLVLLPISFLLGRASIAGALLPFGMAVFSSIKSTECNKLLVAVSVICGMLTKGSIEQIYVTLAGMILFSIFSYFIKPEKLNSIPKSAGLAFVSIMIPQTVMVYLQGFLFFDLIKGLFSGAIVFLLVFIYRNAVSGISRNGVINNEETISITILAAICMLGLGEIQFAGFIIKDIVSVFVIMICSFRCGAAVGAGTGVAIGLIVSMNSEQAPFIIGSYAVCGLISGTFRKLGKIGSSLGFILGNAIFTLYINGSTEILINAKEIILAVLIFMVIPKNTIDAMTQFLGKGFDQYHDERKYYSRIKELTVDRLQSFSKTFKQLSITFNEISETNTKADKQDISVLFDRVADRVCKDCSLCFHCWDRNFYNTYQVMFKIVEELDQKGRIEVRDIPAYFLERCERVNDFVISVNSVYELFKVDMVWKGKISESRDLVSQQLEGLSKVVSGLASEIGNNMHFDMGLEDSMIQNLERIGIRTKEVNVLESRNGKYDVTICHKGCGGKRLCVNSIEKIATEILGRKMIKESSECLRGMKDSSCVLKLVEDEIFNVTTGTSKVSKHKSMVSGDNYTFLNTGNGKYVVAISDGMGSGHKADVQSRAAITMLEQFMETGFDKDTAVKLINSVLVLKSDEECFSTIDLSVVDLYDGEVEFVKIGAVSTFIKREEKVDVVKSASLPAGILSNIETEILKRKVGSGDFLILVTDGVLDAFRDGFTYNDEEFRNFVDGIKSTNPQEIADMIINEAYKKCDSKPSDDMLAVVSKVWKKVG